MGFNVQKVTEDLVKWTRDWFEQNGPGCNAVVGISGGKDSSVVAALMVRALGRERVIGVLMPNGEQNDIHMSHLLVEHLGIEHYTVNIGGAFEATIAAMKAAGVEPSRQTVINLPPRLRMSALYAVSQSRNGRVANTCNLSEDWVGYATKFGDGAGDVSPLGNLLVEEVRQLGAVLGLPDGLVQKTPTDGLSGQTDEDKLGFTYAVLDRYISTGEIDDPAVKERIDALHAANLHKLMPMPTFEK